MHRRIVSLALSTCLAAAAMAGAARAQSAPQTKGPDTGSPPPMVFYVARGEPGACGPGCQEWIAAEGFIDRTAQPRLWELLRKIGNDRKLPVYFQSNGGSLIAGFEIGRLLRARGLTAGVGRTVPATCDRRDPAHVPAKLTPVRRQEPAPNNESGARSDSAGTERAPADAACDELKRSGRALPAELDTRTGACASACVYAILGGATRDIGAGAKLAVHDTSMPPTIRSFDENGRIVDRPLQLSAEKVRNALQAGQQAIALYLKQMGISPDLLTAAHAVSADELHVLTREEIVAFGIDRRDTVESTWSLVDGSPSETSPGVSAVKLIEAREGSAFRKTTLRLTCRDSTTVRLQYIREAGAEDDSPALRVIAGERSLPLMRLAGAAQRADDPRVEVRGAELPLAALDAAAFMIEANATSGQSPDDPAASVRVAVQAAAPPLAALARRCASGMR
jgi:hypothetical protein